VALAPVTVTVPAEPAWSRQPIGRPRQPLDRGWPRPGTQIRWISARHALTNTIAVAPGGGAGALIHDLFDATETTRDLASVAGMPIPVRVRPALIRERNDPEAQNSTHK
jgi:hypothetical protein